uniref:Vacuolar fusion protein MON1 homolog n=1 Tax=Phlebotomus papatasi TaxID=29031 RepID=A0A1B0DG70_PHLPP
MSDGGDVEPGASGGESMLITTDSFEELSEEMSSSFEGAGQKGSGAIGQIGGEVEEGEASNGAGVMTKSDSFCSVQSNPQQDAEDQLQDAEWLGQKRHVFILSTAGKPIYSLHGSEDKLASLFGVMQALVSVVQSNQDAIKSIHTAGMTFVFLVKSPLILVAVSRTNRSVQQIQMQLSDVYNQILSILTLSYMNKIYEKRKNFDLRRLLGGSERLINHLLANCGGNDQVSNNTFSFLTNSVRILPLSPSIRDSITSAIQSNCSKIKNLVFAVLIAQNKLICLIRMKKYFIHPADLRLIFNLIECSESFKAAESWTPICLPKFDPNGYLHAHVSYLADDCEACLLLLSVERDVFFTLSEAKKRITDKLRRSNCLEAINEAMASPGINLRTIGIPEIRHFIYKCKSNAQLLCSKICLPYSAPSEFHRLESLYCSIHSRVHNPSRPLKLLYEMKEREIMLAWVTSGYELYVTFEPLVDRNAVISLVNKLLKWIKKEEASLFIMNAPVF